MDPPEAPESFRSLLLRDRGRTGLVQLDLAERAGVSRRSVQDWEAGLTLPTPERLRALIRALFEAGGLTNGREMLEARELWAAVEREGPRMHAPFDEEWFVGLLAIQQSSGSEPSADADPQSSALDRAQDWGEAPDSTGFVGRGEEMVLLQRRVLDERCRVVALLGMGGIGKTSLAAMLAQTVAPSFERVYWRSLRNAPPVSEWLAGTLGFLSDQVLVPPATESDRITALLGLLRERRCLLVLDNSETLFEPGQREGRYRAGMDGYGRVLQAIGETSHQSCLLITSREAPPELALLGAGIHHLELHGLGISEAQTVLADKHLNGDSQAWADLVDRYAGNGLALKIVGDAIRQVFDADISAFLEYVTANYGAVFGGIRTLLELQIERLSPAERDVLTRLAVEREPVSLTQLSREMARIVSGSTVVESIETLRRRSLVERGERVATFTLQSLVLEYVTDRLVETVADEIQRGQPVVLVEQPLIKAMAKDYVRQTQERLIGKPILQRLDAQDSDPGPEDRLLALLGGWRNRGTLEEHGYGPGNAVNLLRLLRGHVRGLDLSHLRLRQTYLAEVEAQDVRLVEAHLAETAVADAFDFPGSVALSGDGASLAAGMSTGEVWLWRVEDRTPLLVVQGHTGAVWCVSLSGDGEVMASGGEDGTVRVWQTGTGRQVSILQGHTGAVWGVAVSTDGQHVVSSGEDGTVRLWEIATGQALAILPGHTGTVRGVALSVDGQLLASAGEDRTVRLWKAGSGEPLAVLQGHTGAVWGVALSADGQLVASGSEDGTVRLWESGTRQRVATLQGHTGAVWGVALSADGQLLVSGGAAGMVRLWETSTGQPLAILQGHTGMVRGVALSANGQLPVSSGADGTVRLWETATGRPVATLRGDAGMVWGVALSADGQQLVSGSDDGTLRLWETATGGLLSTLHGHTSMVHSVALSADGGVVVSASEDAAVRVWDPGAGRPLATLHRDAGSGIAWGVALSVDGQLLVSADGDGAVRLWQTRTGRPLAELQGHTGTVRGVALSVDGRLLVSGGADGTVRLWDPGTGRAIRVLEGHIGTVRAVALSADGRLLASGGGDATVRLWETGTGRSLATLRGHTGGVWGVALSADGRLLVSGGADGHVRLWDTSTGQPLANLRGHTGMIWSVAMSADGHVLASGSFDGTVKLWEPRSGACVRTLRPERRYERMDITGLTGITEAQRTALLALGAVEQPLHAVV
jgi:WD40 repeat protein/transcriptional regulator with XRE-family HTH domain